ncbi:uncharacterized protein [Argopecten irradians]|uniref:uncharacterized protein isoform X2 n=1 Tax=Argopecten irradians TaxID=31199 RepID=UPI00371EED6F
MSILIVEIIVCMVVATVTAEPCITYENFTAESDRAPSHTESVYANKICDAVLSTKWYRLVGDAGSDLTNDSSVLVDDGCGTFYQLWMNGTVPGVSEGAVDRDICMRSIFSICHNKFTIKVKNCCSFRVYQLKSATNCPQAYCVSSSLVPSDNCSHIVWTTTTVTTTTSTTTTTTTTTLTTITTTTTPAITSHTTRDITTTDHYDNENNGNGNIIGIIIGIVLLIFVIVSILTYFLLWRDTATCTCICKLTNTKWTKYVVNRITVKPKPEENNCPPLVHEAFKSNEHMDPKHGKHKSTAFVIEEFKSNSNESVKPKPGELKSPPSVIEAIQSNSPVKPKPEEHNYPSVVTEAFGHRSIQM